VLFFLPPSFLPFITLSFLLSSVFAQAATTIRSIVGCEEGLKRYVLCVEHDLAVLDYLSGKI
jgi:translation initiation factor RLI1